jgi:hypothetical protein
MRKQDLDIIMNSHIEPSFISLYMDKVYNKTKLLSQLESQVEITCEDLPISGMVSYPVQMKYKNQQHIFHYWDFIWINRIYKNRNCQRILINTHDINVRKTHPEIQCSIFKKTNILCDGIVPIVKYKTFLCNLFYKKYDISKKVNFMRIYKQYYILENIFNNPNMNLLFEFQVYPQLPNIYMQIKTNQLLVYCIKDKDNIISIYFFKETFSLYENNNIRLLRLVSSICNSKNTYIHIIGYMYCIRDIMKNNPIKYGAISIDNISHNDIIINNIDISKKMNMISVDNAYYTYNYVIPQTPMNPGRFFAIL